ncbi:MAG: hypothetical protein JO269_05605 [Burkholderiaceae bacterium]|nr:hypothetical protein [Burkholderiaceae bacterium]
MPTKQTTRLVTGALVLCYPLLVHWVLPHWPAAPAFVLLLPPTLLNLLLAALFGATLRAGREPMIGMFARLEQAGLSGQADAVLPAELASYTRKLTWLWCALFLVMATISAWLACAGPLSWWAWFTGVLSYVLMGLLFLGEYLFRRRRYAHYRHAAPWQLIWTLVKAGPIWLRRQS